LPISPLALKASGGFYTGGFTGINQFTITINWESDLVNKMISIDSFSGNTTFSTIVVTLGAPFLLVGSLTPEIIEPIPPIILYDYTSFAYYDTAGSPTASGQLTTINSQTYTLPSIPNWCVISIQPLDSQQLNTIPDAFFGIENVNILLGNL